MIMNYTYLFKNTLKSGFFSQVIKVYASIYIEGESSENFSVINEITNADQIIPSFIVCQHIWQYHYWLLIVSVLVLLFKGTPINARHGLIFIFPLLGPAVYLAEQVVILVRKRKESRKTEQSMQHPQSAMHAPES